MSGLTENKASRFTGKDSFFLCESSDEMCLDITRRNTDNKAFHY